MDRLAWLIPQQYGRRNHYNDALVGYNWQIFISAMGFLWTRSAVLNFCMPVLVHRSFWKMTCFGYGHVFPRALLPSAFCDPDWPISSLWMFTLAIKFLRDSWVKMTYLYYGLSMSFITSG